MKVIINNNELIFPSCLAEFTLGERIKFQEQYGDELDTILESILKVEDPAEKQLQLTEFQTEKVYRTFAFFAKRTPDEIRESEAFETINNIYYSYCAPLFEESTGVDHKRSFFFNDREWELPSAELSHGDKMQFGEIIDSKQRMQDLKEIGKSRWEQRLSLAAIFLRPKREEYQEEYLFEGSKRLELMKQLPIDIAMHVGFFLNALVGFSMRIFRFSINQKQSRQANI